MPPPKLRILVSGTANAEYFLDTGRRHAALFRSLLERNRGSLANMTAMLDFGCGCGRIIRWWSDLERPAIYGCDPNREMIAWTHKNLPFVTAEASEENPPLPYPDASFDFILAFSVFTHMPEDHALPWIAELRRVLKPGGQLLFTVAGEAYRERLSAEDAMRYVRGEEVVEFETAQGTNLCIAYHSPVYVRNRMLTGYQLIDTWLATEHPKESEQARMPQDCYLVCAAIHPDLES